MLQFAIGMLCLASMVKLTTLLFRNKPSTLPADDPGNPGEFVEVIERNELPNVSKILNANKVLELSHMRRFQEMNSAAYEWDETPLCILFISHRWISPTHPDPEGEQLQAIHFLLNAIKIIAAVYYLPLEERTKDVKTLRVHGHLQAARILSKIAEQNGTIDSSILSRIGIWLDFMCLPQKNASRVDDRTTEELVLFKQGLRTLPSLMVSCDYIVSLRKDHDDYMERAWCISELCVASFKHSKNVIVLREDLLGQPIDESLLRTEQSVDSKYLEQLRQRVDSWEISPQYRGSLDFYYTVLETAEEDKINSHEQTMQGGPNLKKPWPTPFFTTGRPPLIFPNQVHFLMHIRSCLTEAPPRNVSLLVMRTMKECGMSCCDINDYTRCGLHIAHSRLLGHRGWRMFFNDCLFRLSNGESLVLGDAAQVEIEDGLDIGGVVTYKFETDQRMLNLHARATDIWKDQHLQEDTEKTSHLLEAMLRQLVVLGKAYERTPDLGIMELSALVKNAMDFAEIECEGSKVEVGLGLLYAKCQSIWKIRLPGAEKISTFFLNSLERLRNDRHLRISGYQDFECPYVTEVTDELFLSSLRHTFRSENLKLDLNIAATGHPVLTVGSATYSAESETKEIQGTETAQAMKSPPSPTSASNVVDSPARVRATVATGNEEGSLDMCKCWSKAKTDAMALEERESRCDMS
jgi:hypothetical protein